ncbi:MAG TPA: hypothetical protein VGQ42_00480 [Candidatus Dormibacteraeota bacterium]|jgi:hypothetical protein|nr:hypothetical protein [Candidatus Dormibacteraeota bacterium]
MLRSTGSAGAGGGLPINMDTVEAVGSKYGISFPEGTNLRIRGGATLEYTGGTYSATDVDLYHGAFAK